jgi:hypothetical protein
MIDRSMYRELMLLDRNAHRALRLAREVGDLSVGARSHGVFVVASEFVDVCREYPIVFVRGSADAATGKADVVPIAVLGLVQHENLYWDGVRWTARYVPAYLRRYPFAMAQLDSGQLALAIDRSWHGFSQEQGTPMFDERGEPTPTLLQIRDFVERFEHEAERTRQLCARLRDEELLRDMRFEATQADGGTLANVDGFLTVDADKLGALPDAKVVELYRLGLLALLTLHHTSLRVMGQLVERRTGVPAPIGGTT